MPSSVVLCQNAAMDSAILLVPLAAVIAPLLATLISRALVVPLVVFEIGLGMLIGPSGLGWVAEESALLTGISQLGLAMLFFMAGLETDPAALRGRTGRRALGGWGISAGIAAVAALLLTAVVGFGSGNSPAAGFDLSTAAIITIALTGTALGTIMPMLRDAGILHTRLGATILSAGAIGEFAPLIAISIFLSGREPIAGTMTLLVFAAVAGLAFWLAARGPQGWLRRMVTRTLHTSGQFAIRFVIAILAALVTLALVLGVDFLLGAFSAGMLARVVLDRGDPEERRVIETKLDSVAFGFFVPIFFVTTGIGFPLRALLDDPGSLALVPVLAVVMLLVRGIPGFWAPEPGTAAADRRTSAFFTATTLPLVIAVTTIGAEQGVLDERAAAALVGGAMLTVLLFPMLGLQGRRTGADPGAAR